MEIGWNRRWTAIAAVGSLAAVVMCAWFAHALAFEGFGDLKDSSRVIVTAMFVAFGLLMTGAAATYALATFGAGTVVTLGQAGVHDRRLTRAPIPWAEIASVTPFQRGTQLMLLLHVEKPGRLPLPANPLWALNRLNARMLGTPELALKVTGLAADLPTVLAAIQAHAADAPPGLG